MRVTDIALVTSVPPTMKRPGPGGEDAGPAWRAACLASWPAPGWRVVTLNPADELAALIDHFDHEHRGPAALVEDSWLASDDGNGMLARTGFAPGRGLGVKLASVFPRNTDRPTVHSLYALFDPDTGEERAVIAGNAITWSKTAADSGLGTRRLARTDSERLLMVGAGSMAPPNSAITGRNRSSAVWPTRSRARC